MSQALDQTSKVQSTDLLRQLYRGMRIIRETEEQLAKLFADGEIPGFIHLSIGQEGVPAGIGPVLETSDTLASNHRGHGHALTKGLELRRFFLEIMGRADGYCRGRGGSMHVANMAVGMLGANGIVGAGLPIAVGSALAHKVRGTKNIAVVFFGDGALGEGVLHESLNLAALWKLPVLFVCENNGWSEFSQASSQLATEPLKLADAFGMPSERIDGNDVLAVHNSAREAVAAIREGGGPRFLECKTTRMRGHFEGDPQKYRNPSDLEQEAAYDPLVRCASQLQKLKVSASAIAAIDEEIRRDVTSAVAEARAGALPSPADALADVYSPLRVAAL